MTPQETIERLQKMIAILEDDVRMLRQQLSGAVTARQGNEDPNTSLLARFDNYFPHVPKSEHLYRMAMAGCALIYNRNGERHVSTAVDVAGETPGRLEEAHGILQVGGKLLDVTAHIMSSSSALGYEEALDMVREHAIKHGGKRIGGEIREGDGG